MFYELSNWLDNVLKQPIPENVVAFCFNLYEDSGNDWSMELIGTERFDIEDEDWCCDEIADFGTREKRFTWNQEVTWDKILQEMIFYLEAYLDHGRYSEVLKSKKGIGVGFVDGDVEIIFTR